jgi:SAM-dependent methyltransferase
LTNAHASNSTQRSNAGSYDLIAAEYYDEVRHPTCADFRLAGRIYLERLFASAPLRGRIAEIGSGKSLVAEFLQRDLVLIDKSAGMLAYNGDWKERRIVDVEEQPFGHQEFDWVIAFLGDPFNSDRTWRNIGESLKPGGRCIFSVPSFVWAMKFRNESELEKEGFAAFEITSGELCFVKSTIRTTQDQFSVISRAGLSGASVDHIRMSELPIVRSPKLSKTLGSDDPVLDIYRASNR